VTACGVWLGRRGLAAVLADGGGRIRLATTIPATNAARAALVELLAAVNADLVVEEPLLPADPIAFVARRAGVHVWVAGPPLVAALRIAAGIDRGPPRASAALLARLPAIPWLRTHLRRIDPADDPRQVPLL
jgi:hypothetical protein